MEAADKTSNDIGEYHHSLRWTVSADPCKGLKKTDQQPERKKTKPRQKNPQRKNESLNCDIAEGYFNTANNGVFLQTLRHIDKKACLLEQQNTEA